jgi:hypothetical protein
MLKMPFFLQTIQMKDIFNKRFADSLAKLSKNFQSFLVLDIILCF